MQVLLLCAYFAQMFYVSKLVFYAQSTGAVISGRTFYVHVCIFVDHVKHSVPFFIYFLIVVVVNVIIFSGWYEINLDKRKLRTPAGNLFRVPNEALALAVATEWNGQEKLVKRHKMHLVSFVVI